VLALATERFLAGERVDMQGIARDLGLARATMHRWFGTRETLLGEMIGELAEKRIALVRSQATGEGARVLLACCDRFNRNVSATKGLGVWLVQEQERALRILTSSAGLVQPRVVAMVERLIDDEIKADLYVPIVAPQTLAYAIVRLGESFLYNDAMFGIRGDTQRLREVQAALLGLS
jgi:AcrR family transcriptional regulator